MILRVKSKIKMWMRLDGKKRLFGGKFPRAKSVSFIYTRCPWRPSLLEEIGARLYYILESSRSPAAYGKRNINPNMVKMTNRSIESGYP